jgi:hypothetical protein
MAAAPARRRASPSVIRLPALALPDLSGQTMDLADFRGLTVG